MDSVIDNTHSEELLTGRMRKRLTDLIKAENLKDIEVKLNGMDQSAVNKKLRNTRRDELAKSLIPRDFEETLSLQSGVGSVSRKQYKKLPSKLL